jgi:hypothetical protein
MIPVCGLKHLARVLRGCKAFGQVSWLRETKSFLNTVARPRGIHTRFPILPKTRGTQTLNQKIDDKRADTNTRHKEAQAKPQKAHKQQNQLNSWFVFLCLFVASSKMPRK